MTFPTRPAGADASVSTASTVSRSAAAARPAAAVSVSGGQSLVFTRPGTGAFAITNTVN